MFSYGLKMATCWERQIWATPNLSSVARQQPHGWTWHVSPPAARLLGTVRFCQALEIGFWRWMDKEHRLLLEEVFHELLRIPFVNPWTMLIHLTSTALRWEKTYMVNQQSWGSLCQAPSCGTGLLKIWFSEEMITHSCYLQVCLKVVGSLILPEMYPLCKRFSK